MRPIPPAESISLDDYGAHAHLAGAVAALRAEGALAREAINGRSVLMVNSTSQGGGVAEMLPTSIALMEELGVRTRWAVMDSADPAFFRLTKRLHNLIHGENGCGSSLQASDRELYEAVARSNLDELRTYVRPDDVLVIHDPQPMALGAMLKRQMNITALWRCHIGLDEQLPATRAAWEFLQAYAQAYDLGIFSAPEYIPNYFKDRASILYPAIDPLSHKNRHLRPDKVIRILCDAGLAVSNAPTLVAPFPRQAQRLQPDGSFGAAILPDEIGFLHRPTIAQISRWDRLKGWQQLLEGFARLKAGQVDRAGSWSVRHRTRIEMTRLILAGPDPDSIQDDPEGRQTLNDLCAAYLALAPVIQRDVVLLALPMNSRRDNALMVNALQSASSVVVQNSIREGFGLTLTEAMWKGTPVIGSSACGLRQQMRDGIHGRVVNCPTNPVEVAEVLDDMLSADQDRHRWARNAQTRVHSEFLVFKEVQTWLRMIRSLLTNPAPHRTSGTTNAIGVASLSESPPGTGAAQRTPAAPQGCA